MSGAAAAVDPAFKGIGKNHSVFTIWRVEDMKLVPLPKEQYGKFFNGDSYLVYSAFEVGQPCGTTVSPKECRGPLERFIHFWLGSQTSQDEAGVAAIKAVELDDFLGGSPVQQREVEGSESSRFLSYFKDGVRVSQGGIASGFKHVTDDFQPEMFSVKGRRTPIVRQLPKICWSVMNEGDVYVIDCKETVFVWIGQKANNYEKMQGAKLAQTIKSDHGIAGSKVVIVDDGHELALPVEERATFEKLLPLAEKKLQTVDEAVADESQEKSVVTEIKLYRCTDDDGTLKVIEVKKGPLFQADLANTDSYIVDNGPQGVFVWVGKGATKQERTEAMRNAQGFVKKKEYPASTRVVRVIDGGEPPEFKSLFRGWKDKDQTSGLGKQHTVGKIAKTVQTSFDASTLHDQPQLAAQSQMVDDGTGKKQVYRVYDFELHEVAQQEYGKFYGGDCYVINYTYNVGTQERSIVYYWLGAHAGQDEKGTAALKAVELDDKMGGKAVQVRVVQGKEPPHFLAMFGGKMIIFMGGKASSFDGDDAKDEELASSYLLQVRGNASHNSRAIQVPMKASSLNSNDVFVLMSPTAVYVWCGKGSTGDEREVAKQLAAEGKADPVIVSEGQEKDDFWKLLGGKGDYSSDKRSAEDFESHPPRLFQCSNATGSFKAEQVVDFNQSDLVEDDVMILDAWDSIFIWVGVNSNPTEQKKAEQLAIDYLRSDPTGRDQDTPIMRIKQGYEPPTFTGFFGVWDPAAFENRMTFDKLKDLLSESEGTIILTSSGKQNGHTPIFYPLSVLQQKDTDKLPKDVDPTKKEEYLHENDFQVCFKITKEAFTQLPVWKQQQLKKNAGIF